MKKHVIKLLAYLCALSMLLSFSAGAESGEAWILPEDKTVNQGIGTESVAIPITLSGNPGIAGITLKVSYTEGITLTQITRGTALSSLTYTNPGDLNKNPLNIIWDGLEADSSNGIVATLIFEVPKNETKEFVVTVAPEGVFDNNVNEISLPAASSKITVSSAVSAVEYKYSQNAQIRLIEPWALKANARVYTSSQTSSIDYDSLIDYGAYFIRASKLADPAATQTSLTVEDIINNPNASKYSKAEGTASVDKSNSIYITAIYDKGLYTYEFDDSVFVLFYIQDNSGFAYAPIRERNLKSLLETRQNDTANFSVLERSVYKSMLSLFDTVTAYRNDYFAKN